MGLTRLFFFPDGSAVGKKPHIVLLVNQQLDFDFWTQYLYSDIRSNIRKETRLLPSRTVQIFARCANLSFTHTIFAFTSILTRATPVYKTEIIT